MDPGDSGQQETSLPSGYLRAYCSGSVSPPPQNGPWAWDARDAGEEPTYNGVPMSTIVEKGFGVGDVISLLWFKRSLPAYCTRFIEVPRNSVLHWSSVVHALH